MTISEGGEITILKNREFRFPRYFHLASTVHQSSRRTAKALVMRLSISFPYRPSLENQTPDVLELLHLFQWNSKDIQDALCRVSRENHDLRLGDAPFRSGRSAFGVNRSEAPVESGLKGQHRRQRDVILPPCRPPPGRDCAYRSRPSTQGTRKKRGTTLSESSAY